MVIEAKVKVRNRVLRGSNYWLVCDKCKTQFPDKDSKLVFLDVIELCNHAAMEGWDINEHRSLCSACYEQKFEGQCALAEEKKVELGIDLNDWFD